MRRVSGGYLIAAHCLQITTVPAKGERFAIFDGKRHYTIMIDRDIPVTPVGATGLHDAVVFIADSRGVAYGENAEAVERGMAYGLNNMLVEAPATRADGHGQNSEYTTYLHEAGGACVAGNSSTPMDVVGAKATVGGIHMGRTGRSGIVCTLKPGVIAHGHIERSRDEDSALIRALHGRLFFRQPYAQNLMLPSGLVEGKQDSTTLSSFF